jgi:hypothetical protein
MSNREKVFFWLSAEKVFFNLSDESFEGGVDMCKKLSVFCLLLVAVALCVPASASNVTVANPLRVDIDGGGVANTDGGGWSPWLFPRDFTGPQSTTINNGGLPTTWPTVTYEYVPTIGFGGGSRDRGGGMVFVGGTGEPGMGRNYAKVTFTNLQASTNYTLLMWGWEREGVWVYDGNCPDRKFGMWSTTNPNAWLVANGYSGQNGEPNGYQAKVVPTPPGTTDSNMPAGLAALAYQHGARLFMESPLDTTLPDWYIGDEHYCRFSATSDSSKTLTLYGWMDASNMGGSLHMPLNGLILIPEPATVALLGLGGLLLRRKRA